MSEKVYCKWCGRSYPSLMAMAGGTCNKNPNNQKSHERYNGTEKAKYECNWCGRSYPSLMAMAGGTCSKTQNRRHEPV